MSRDRVPNWYRELGVPRDASTEEIKVAFRRRARATHTDMTGADGSVFARVSEAFEVLSDPVKRAEFDRQLDAQGDFSTDLVPTARPASRRSESSTRTAAPPRTKPVPPRAPRAPRVGPKLRPLRWVAVMVVVALAGNLMRFTGLPAAVFGFTDGERMLVGGRWHGVPAIEAGWDLNTISAVAMWAFGTAIIASPLVAAWVWRSLLRPVPRTERVLALAGWFVTASAWEVLMVRSAYWQVAGIGVGVWLAWVFLLTRFPDPTDQGQWDRFTAWVSALRAARRTASDVQPVSADV